MSGNMRKRNVISKMIKINGEMLRKAIYDRGLVPSNISKEMGFNSCYISHAYNEGVISPAVYRMLDVLYGIKPEEYLWKDPEPAKEEPVTVGTTAAVMPDLNEAFWDRLNQTIYRAVYGALKRVYNEPYRPGQEVVDNEGNQDIR